jgi:hypothetical protein
MASVLEQMSPLEKAAAEQWRAFATHVHYGRCDSCGRVRGDDGKALLVARQPRSRKFQCLPCWDQGH